jgi:hypothetical protein
MHTGGVRRKGGYSTEPPVKFSKNEIKPKIGVPLAILSKKH